MRKKDKDSIAQLIPVIQNALKYCRGLGFDHTKDILSDCDKALIEILDILNNSKCSNKELYYFNIEKAYCLVQEFVDTEALIQNNKCEIVINLLDCFLVEFKNETVEYEIVFLPYKACMWDSFDSIWKAACKDARCNCKVIPIPYYNKNSKGELVDMFYEGDLFPQNIPITHYNDYDLEQMLPDVIYIHTPYDNFNKVTSINPFYYSYNLKKYTNMLVYIPYFVTMDNLAEEFVILPGVKFADKIIVESKKIANQYKKFYPYDDNDKFIPLGSPKIDKVMEMGKLSLSELNIPEAWKKIIKNKKIILYNTHLNNLINNGDAFIKKLRFVFANFENRDDAILLWRPHPLSTDTITAMNCKILDEYQEIKKMYMQKKIGIFDETPELHRSISMADAYLGDGSSLVALFEVTDKPIMLQDVNIDDEITEDILRSLSFEDAYIDEKNIWISSSQFNGLFCMDKANGNVQFKGQFLDEECNSCRLYSKVIRYKDKLFFVPFSAKNIAIYDLCTEMFNKITIKKGNIYDNKFYSYICYKNYIYMISGMYPEIIKLDLDNNEIVYMKEWSKIVEKCVGNNNDFRFVNVRSKNGKIYAPFFQKNILFIFNMENNEVEQHLIGENVNDSFSSIEFYKNDLLFISSNDEKLVIWNKDTKMYKEIKMDIQLGDKPYYIDSFLHKDKLYMLDAVTEKIFYFDFIESRLTILLETSKKADIDKIYYRNIIKYANIKKTGKNELTFFPLANSEMVKLDLEHDTIKKEMLKIPMNWGDNYMEEYILNNIYLKIHYETLDNTIDDFINNVVNKKFLKNKRMKKYNAGNAINNYIIDSL